MIDLVSKRYWYFALSLLVIVPGLISLLIPPALKPGIEFSAGTTMTIQFERAVSEKDLLDELAALGHSEAVPQRQKPVSEVAVLVDTETLNHEPDKVKQGLARQFGKLSEFTPGAILQVQFPKPVPEADLRDELTRLGHPEATLERQTSGEGERWRIATKALVLPVTKQDLKEKEPGEEAKLRDALAKRFGEPRQFLAKDVMSVTFEGAVSAEQLRDELAAQGHPEAIIQPTLLPNAAQPSASASSFSIDLSRLSPQRPALGDGPPQPPEEAKLGQALSQRFGNITKFQVSSKVLVEFYSPVTAEDLQAELKSQGQGSAQVTFDPLPDGLLYSISTTRLQPAVLEPTATIVTPGEEEALKSALEQRFGASSFVAGSSYRLKFGRGVTDQDLTAALTGLGFSKVSLRRQDLNQGDAYFLRTRPLSAEERDRVNAALRNRLGPLTIIETATVDPVVAGETARNAFLAVVVAAVFILLYIWWAFRRLRHSFRYSVAAIVALVHDVLVVLGIFSIMGKVANVEVNAMFITGMLTVVGFSVHDTIVVFDRIRENLGRADAPPFEVAVNNSLVETLGRSLNTSITLLLTLLALLLFGGATLRDFVLVIFIGVVTGTYSSIAIASQLVVSWERGEFARALRSLRQRLPFAPGAARSQG